MSRQFETGQGCFVRQIALVVVAAALISGCKRKTPPASVDSSDVMDSTIHGQVFIVTRGAENVRLGNLKVFLVSRSDFDALQLTTRAEAEVAELSRTWDNARKVGDETERLVSEIIASYKALLEQREHLLDRLHASELVHEKYDTVSKEIFQRDQMLTAFRENLEKVSPDSYLGCRKATAAVRSIPQRLVRTASEQLVSRSSTSRTDADGRFRFECSSQRNYVVFTRGQRQLPGGGNEQYDWFVAALPSRDEKRQLLLTNANVVDGRAADNLMRETFSAVYAFPEEPPPSQPRKLPERKALPPEPEWAPSGYHFLVRYRSVTTPSGVTGFAPGTQVKELEHAGDKYVVEAAGIRFELATKDMIDNVAIARHLRDADANAQSEIALWQDAEREAEKQDSDAENQVYDDAQRRIQENYKRLHILTGESRLTERPHH